MSEKGGFEMKIILNEMETFLIKPTPVSIIEEENDVLSC